MRVDKEVQCCRPERFEMLLWLMLSILSPGSSSRPTRSDRTFCWMYLDVQACGVSKALLAFAAAYKP